MTLPAVIEDLRTRAQNLRRRIVLPEVDDPRMVEARRSIEECGLADIVWVEDPAMSPWITEVAEHIYQQRKHRGGTSEDAVRLSRDPLYFGASLVHLGHADASVAGAAHPTADVIRAGIHCVGTAPEISTVSSTFLMVRGEEVFSYADCGVVPQPDTEQLVEIAKSTAQNHALLSGQRPRVAFLSFSTRGSASHPRVETVRQAANQFRKQCPGTIADGELQFDSAYVPGIAAQKAPESPIAGMANVFIFPDLGAGNIAYKISERLGGFLAFGPIVQGLAKPCLDLSRGCGVSDIENVVAVASVMSGSGTG